MTDGQVQKLTLWFIWKTKILAKSITFNFQPITKIWPQILESGAKRIFHTPTCSVKQRMLGSFSNHATLSCDISLFQPFLLLTSCLHRHLYVFVSSNIVVPFRNCENASTDYRVSYSVFCLFFKGTILSQKEWYFSKSVCCVLLN